MLSFSDLNPIESLTRNHDRKSFISGVSKLDNYLRDRSIVDIEKHISRVFVLTLRQKPQTIAGYYSLSSLLVPMDGISEAIRTKLPKYEALGTTLLGRLAIAEHFQRDKCNLRLGEHLLIDAMHRSYLASQQVASYALVVDVLIGEKGDPTGFYTKNNFIPYESKKDRLYLPMATIEQLLRTQDIIS
ncbi:GNAT family N-acetyltransferase [soil metagenome]